MTDAAAAQSGVANPALKARNPRINTIYMDHPWTWLSTGLADLRAAPMASLPFGAVFAVLGLSLTYIVWVQEVFYLTFPLAAGFFLVGPLIAVGFYEVSRRLSQGLPVTLGDALQAYRKNGSQIALMGVVLMLFMFAWVRLASLLFLMFFASNPPQPEVWPFLAAVLSFEAVPFLIVGNLIGFVLATIVFGISAISIPMLLDRPESHVIQAISTSWQACMANKKTMMLWAWLIVLFVGAGIATGFVGLIVTLPLIGHATWAAYKDLVTWPEAETAEA